MRCFFATNIVVYLFDESAQEKHRRARQLFTRTAREGLAVLSTQVLQEFFVTVTRKLPVPLPHDQAERAVRRFVELPIVQIDPNLVIEAIERARLYRLSFWDGLIVSSALHGGAGTLSTEDLPHGQVIETLRIENPFLNS